jgi:hypothetical protein
MGSACTSVTDADEVLGGKHECLSIQTRQSDVKCVRQNAILVAVELHAETPERPEYALAKQTARVRTHYGVFCRQFCGKTETYDEWNWQCARAQTPLLPSTE